MKFSIVTFTLLLLLVGSSNGQQISPNLCNQIFDLIEHEMAPTEPSRRDVFRESCVYDFVTGSGLFGTRIDINFFLSKKFAKAEFRSTIKSFGRRKVKSTKLSFSDRWDNFAYFEPVAPRDALFVFQNANYVITGFSFESAKLERIAALIDRNHPLFQMPR